MICQAMHSVAHVGDTDVLQRQGCCCVAGLIHTGIPFCSLAFLIPLAAVSQQRVCERASVCISIGCAVNLVVLLEQ